MHGIEQIKQMNEDPSHHAASREPQHHGQQVRRGDDVEGLLAPFISKAKKSVKEAEVVADLLGLERSANHDEQVAEVVMVAAVLDGFGIARPDDFDEARALAKAVAKLVGIDITKLFNGGPTPKGALTFIGKEWDGLRAIPATPIEGKPVYNGEFRQVSAEGTVWRTVHNQYGAVAYMTAEAALEGARVASRHAAAERLLHS